MKSFSVIFSAFALYASVSAAPRRHRNKAAPAAIASTTPVEAPAIGNAATDGATGEAAGEATGAATGGSVAVTRGASTLVLFEIGGIPGNECLTFRNNGEIVDAACVNTAADRQITPSTLNGADVLLVQRSFTAGFRADLVGVDACVGFNGTTFLAQDCAGANFQAVRLVNNQLKAGVACQSGHDGAAQLTVDPTGVSCVDVTSTTVTATAP